MKNNRSLGLIKHFEENKIVLRIAALIIDYCFIALIYGAITTFLLKLDLISLETIVSNENNSLYMFLIYLFFLFNRKKSRYLNSPFNPLYIKKKNV